MSDIRISEVSWYPIKPTEKGLVGFASLRYCDLSLSSIAVYVKPDGNYRLLFPDKALPNGKMLQVFYPVNNDTYELMLNAIVEKIKSLTE